MTSERNTLLLMIEKIITFGQMIKFSHTIFALPFVLSSVVLAAKQDYTIQNRDIFWIILAMVGARSAAMGFNRIVDASFDAKNPRTSKRAIPTGEITRVQSIVFVVLFSFLFLISSAQLAMICFYCGIPVLMLLFGYSYSKRFTYLCHIYLGVVISLAPVGAWVAITKSLDWPIFILSLALLTHISGFDILYACQDYSFDQQEGLYSIPAQYGISASLFISSLIHVICFLSFVAIYFIFDMNFIYFLTLIIIGIALLIEHLIVKPDNLSKVPVAFFHINSAISLVFFAGIAGDILICQM
jgi:4-hydroxybenzoate polyprenyltransferase